jgi:hypothetical protein
VTTTAWRGVEVIPAELLVIWALWAHVNRLVLQPNQSRLEDTRADHDWRHGANLDAQYPQAQFKVKATTLSNQRVRLSTRSGYPSSFILID